MLWYNTYTLKKNGEYLIKMNNIYGRPYALINFFAFINFAFNLLKMKLIRKFGFAVNKL